jgi:hypothetical protein
VCTYTQKLLSALRLACCLEMRQEASPAVTANPIMRKEATQKRN